MDIEMFFLNNTERKLH